MLELPATQPQLSLRALATAEMVMQTRGARGLLYCITPREGVTTLDFAQSEEAGPRIHLQ